MGRFADTRRNPRKARFFAEQKMRPNNTFQGEVLYTLRKEFASASVHPWLCSCGNSVGFF
jgi:hypothetical protein